MWVLLLRLSIKKEQVLLAYSISTDTYERDKKEEQVPVPKVRDEIKVKEQKTTNL